MKGGTKTTCYVTEPSAYPLNELVSHSRPFTQIQVSNGSKINFNESINSHYYANIGSEGSLRRLDEECVDISNLGGEGLDMKGILATTKIYN